MPTHHLPVQFSEESMVSRHEILKTYISGMYAHEDEGKQELLEKWRGKYKILQGIFDTQFLRSVVGVYGAIVVLSKLCKCMGRSIQITCPINK